MLWRALNSSSLWAVYFRAKYIGDSNPTEVSFRNMKGHMRIRWLPAYNFLQQHTKVVVGNGLSTNFWFDNWFGNSRLESYVPRDLIPNKKVTVSQCISNPTPEEYAFINNYLPTHIQNALRHVTLSLFPDKKVWSLSNSGNCLTSSIYKTSSSRDLASPILTSWSNIWSVWLPTKISVLIWKIINGCIPVDTNIQAAGIPFCSKCQCCNSPCVEDINHLFLRNESASHIWLFFRKFELQVDGSSIRSTILVRAYITFEGKICL